MPEMEATQAGEVIFEVRWSTSRRNLTFRPDRSTAPNARQTLARPMPSPLAMAVALRTRPAAATRCWRAEGCSPKGSRAVVDECRHVLVHDRLPSVALVLVPLAHSGDLPPRDDIEASQLGLGQNVFDVRGQLGALCLDWPA